MEGFLHGNAGGLDGFFQSAPRISTQVDAAFNADGGGSTGVQTQRFHCQNRGRVQNSRRRQSSGQINLNIGKFRPVDGYPG